MSLSLGLGLWSHQGGGPTIPWTPASQFQGSARGRWHDLSEPGSVWQDTGGTTAATMDGDPIGRIDDLSGRGSHLLQGNASLKPTLRVSGGLYHAEFGTTKWMSTTDLPGDPLRDARIFCGASTTGHYPYDYLLSWGQLSGSSQAYVYRASTNNTVGFFAVGGAQVENFGGSAGLHDLPLANYEFHLEGTPGLGALSSYEDGVLDESDLSWRSPEPPPAGAGHTGDFFTNVPSTNNTATGADFGGLNLYALIHVEGDPTLGNVTQLRNWIAARIT